MYVATNVCCNKCVATNVQQMSTFVDEEDAKIGVRVCVRGGVGGGERACVAWVSRFGTKFKLQGCYY